MSEQTLVDLDTGEALGSRNTTPPAPRNKEWVATRRDAPPAFDADTQVLDRNDRYEGGEYVHGHTVRDLTAQQLKDKHNSGIQGQIDVEERKQNRAIREHALGDPSAEARLQAIENKIVALRGQLQ